MKEQLIQVLNQTMVPDSATVTNATVQLSELSKKPNYCMMMMQIADDQNQSIPIRQAALIQFKNTARKYWFSNSFQIGQQQKSAILGVLIQAFNRASSNYLLLKLYKQIVTNIIGHVYKTWMPIQQLCNKLQTQANPIPTIHFLIAIQTNFQISINQEERQVFYMFLKTIFPALSQLIQKNSNEQIIYLIMKILWKAVHFELSYELRAMICNWMDLILSVAGASNSALQSKIQETQQKGTQQFYYFHAKKWATRIIYRFINKHASPNSPMLANQQVKKQNKDFAKLWFDTYGQKIVQIIVKQFLVPSIKKTRCFQLKCLTNLINNHPQEMKQYSQSFQYKILPQYLQLQPEDEQLANTDPLQFISRQEQVNFGYSYLKKQAKQAWVAFTNIGAKKKKKGKQQQIGVLFQQNMNYLKSKLQGSNALQKQMAMYLICELRSSIKNSQQVKKMLPGLISQYIVPQFTSSIMFLRARSMQIFDDYGDIYFDKSILKKAVEGVYFCLTQDNFPLVRLRAARALHILVQHQQARQQLKPLFQQILQIYLLLMSKYDSQALVFSLSGIVQHFSVQVGPYACELMKYLSKHFVKLLQKDKIQSQDVDYDGQTQFAAAGVLNTMKILLQSPIQRQNIAKMENDVLEVCDYVFCVDDSDYIQDALLVLKAYTHRATVMSQKLLFYYSLVIYYTVGIDKQFWPKIQQLQIPQINKKCLKNVSQCCQIQRIDTVMLVLRNYIALDTETLLKRTDLFGVNLLQLLFNMVNHIYQKGPNQFQGEVQMNSSTIVMGYLLQNNHKKLNENILNHIWQVIKYNLQKAKSKVLKYINAQVIGLYLWNNPQKCIALAQTDNLLTQMIVCLLNSQIKIKQQHQRQRVILGLSQLIALQNKPAQLMPYLPKIFNLAIHFVKKNCDYRLDQNCDQNFQTDSQEDDQQGINDLQKLDFGQDEPEDIWQQDYQNNYSSKLDEVDQIKYFKESIQRLQNQQPSFYKQLLSLIPADQLSCLDQKMSKAIQGPTQ